MMPSQLSGSGGLALQVFTQWFAGIQRDEAQVLKQQRLMKEEQAHLAKTGAAPPGGVLGASTSGEKRARKTAAKAAKTAAAKASAGAGRA